MKFYKAGRTYYCVKPNGKCIIVVCYWFQYSIEITIYYPERHDKQEDCTQDEFIAAYAEADAAIKQESGIESILLFDNTQNPES